MERALAAQRRERFAAADPGCGGDGAPPAWARVAGLILSGLVAHACAESGASGGDVRGDGQDEELSAGFETWAESSGESGAETTGDDDDPSNDACENHSFDPGPAQLRRLSPSQYRQTLHDLFPGVSFPQYAFASVAHEDHFDHHSASQHPSPLWLYQLQVHAVDAASRIVVSGPQGDCNIDDDDEALTCLFAYVDAQLPRVLRRPVLRDEGKAYRQLAEASLQQYGPAAALELLLQAMLQDPGFIYFLDPAGLEDPARTPAGHALYSNYAMASRLSYFLWNTMPDDQLFAAAAAGELQTEAQIARQAERMLRDARVKSMLENFARQYFAIDRLSQLHLQPGDLPDLSAELVASMHDEMHRFVGEVVLEQDGGLQELLLTQHSFVNEALAKVYGLDWQAGDTWQWRALDPGQRSGILTTPGFLAAHTVGSFSSPVRRGIYVLSRLLCSPPPPPPDNLDTSIPPQDPSKHQSTRERFEVHSQRPECAGCHRSIDGIGFGFEGYGPLGAHRTEDNFRPVDESGTIELDGQNHDFTGPVELAALLAESPQVHHCHQRWWLEYALARSVEDFDTCTLRRLQAEVPTTASLRELWLGLATAEAFRSHRLPPESGAQP